LISLSTTSSPTIDTVRNALVLESGKWFRRLSISSGLVALGCALETWETAIGITRWTRMRRGLPVREENPTSWHIPIAAVGLVFVIAGVIGEGIFEAKVSKLETLIRAHDEAILGRTILDAGSAKQSAIDAAVKAREAKDNAKIALSDSGTATVVANAAREIAGQAELTSDAALSTSEKAKEEVASLGAELASAKQQEAELEAAIAPRLLPPSDVTASPGSLPALFVKFRGQKVSIEYDDFFEPSLAAEQLNQLLSLAGWKTVVKPSRSFLGEGIRVRASHSLIESNDPSLRPIADAKAALAAFIRSCGWDANDIFSTLPLPSGNDSISVEIGEKPYTYFDKSRTASQIADELKYQDYKHHEDAETLTTLGFPANPCHVDRK